MIILYEARCSREILFRTIVSQVCVLPATCVSLCVYCKTGERYPLCHLLLSYVTVYGVNFKNKIHTIVLISVFASTY